MLDPLRAPIRPHRHTHVAFHCSLPGFVHNHAMFGIQTRQVVAAVGLALITTVNQLSQGIVSLYSSITQDLSSIGANQQ